jgi:hypothetical protein
LTCKEMIMLLYGMRILLLFRSFSLGVEIISGFYI